MDIPTYDIYASAMSKKRLGGTLTLNLRTVGEHSFTNICGHTLSLCQLLIFTKVKY